MSLKRVLLYIIHEEKIEHEKTITLQFSFVQLMDHYIFYYLWPVMHIVMKHTTFCI